MSLTCNHLIPPIQTIVRVQNSFAISIPVNKIKGFRDLRAFSCVDKIDADFVFRNPYATLPDFRYV